MAFFISRKRLHSSPGGSRVRIVGRPCAALSELATRLNLGAHLGAGIEVSLEKRLAASYFDVDGTLVKTNLVHPTLYYLRNQGTPLKSLRHLGSALFKAPAMLFAEMQDRRTFNELLYSTYRGVSEDRAEVLSSEVFDEVMKPNFYPYARDLVAQAKRAGHRVVLISGALDCVLRHVGDYLGADDTIGNKLEMKDGVATGKILQPVVAGPTKARLIREHAKEHSFDLDDCYGFSDSYSDVPMLSVVGHPAAVNPDKRLSLLAKAYDWPTMELS